MNPFETDKIFNSKLYECINKINKKSDKNIVKGFVELLKLNDASLSDDNVMIRSALEKHLRSQNTEIKNLSSDLLYKILSQNSKNLDSLLAIWFVRFIEDHSYKTDKLIYKKYINLGKILERVIEILDWKNDLLGSYKTLLFLLKNSTTLNICKMRDYFLSKIKFIKYNFNISLKYLYAILNILGPIEEIYEKISDISVPVLINIKWKILFEIYKKIPSCINQDAEFIEQALLEKIISDVEDLNNIKVRNLSNFKIVLSKCKDKFYFFKNNINRLNKTDICIYSVVDSFKIIDDNFDDAKDMARLTIERHGLRNFTSEDLEKFISNIDLIDGLKQKDKIDLLCTECNKSQLNIFKDLIRSLNYLSNKNKIFRASQLDIYLNSKYFELKEIYSSSVSIDVFKKEVFKDFKNFTPLICKYPEDYTEKEVFYHLNWENLYLICKLPKFTYSVKKWLKLQETDEIFCHLNNNFIKNFPKEFDLFFYCKGLTKQLRFIDYDEVPTESLEFISNMPIFCQNELNTSILKKLSEFDIPITTEFNDEFYSDIPYFYQNVGNSQNDTIKDLQNILNFYKDRMILDVEKLIFLICNVMLNCESKDVKLNKLILLDLKKNNFYLYKVYKDLGYKLEEPFQRNKELISLLEEDIKSLNITSDHNLYIKLDIKIDKQHVKVLNQQILRGFYPKIENTTFLSEKALKIFVEYLKDDFEIFKCLDYIENDNSLPGNIKRLLIYKPVLDLISDFFANSMINNYILLHNEYLINEDELYEFLFSGIPQRTDLFRIILPDTLMKIRNLNLLFFIEKNISKTYELLYLDSLPKYQIKLAFLFPALHRKYFKKSILDIKDFLINELEHKIENVKTKIIPRSTGFKIYFKYQIDDNCFDCEIIIPQSYPLKPFTFTTNVEKKSLLNLKISEMLRRTTKFMEVINLWKINIDQKSLGIQECYICYFILHIQDGSFPNYICFHCENKFHTKCIEKWMLGYKKSNCPLCRKLFPL